MRERAADAEQTMLCTTRKACNLKHEVPFFPKMAPEARGAIFQVPSGAGRQRRTDSRACKS